MVPDADKTSLGLEFFCSEGDSTWSLSDAELVELATRELDRDRAGAPRGRRGRLRLPREPRLPDLRCQLPGGARVRQVVPGRARQLPDDRAQRAAPLQQPGPCRALRPAGRAQRACRDSAATTSGASAATRTTSKRTRRRPPRRRGAVRRFRRARRRRRKRARSPTESRLVGESSGDGAGAASAPGSAAPSRPAARGDTASVAAGRRRSGYSSARASRRRTMTAGRPFAARRRDSRESNAVRPS